MKNKFKNTLLVIMAAIFAFSTYKYIGLLNDRKAADKSYASAVNSAVLPSETDETEIIEAETDVTEEIVIIEETNEIPLNEEPVMEDIDDEIAKTLMDTDLNTLRETNSDVIGWIVIPDTQLSYPLMQSSDNQFYLEHTWDKVKSSSGSIFMERLNNDDLSHYHTLIYGHRMADGSMFGTLKYYTSEEFLEAHPFVYIVNDKGVYKYQVFSVYEASVGSRTYQIGFKDDRSKEDFISHCVDSSVINTDISPSSDDKILTLSTCTALGSKTNRLVVHTKLEKLYEKSAS